MLVDYARKSILLRQGWHFTSGTIVYEQTCSKKFVRSTTRFTFCLPWEIWKTCFVFSSGKEGRSKYSTTWYNDKTISWQRFLRGQKHVFNNDDNPNSVCKCHYNNMKIRASYKGLWHFSIKYIPTIRTYNSQNTQYPSSFKLKQSRKQKKPYEKANHGKKK